MPELIFTGKLAEIRRKLQAGKRVPATVDLDEAVERLEIGPKVSFSEDELEVIRKIQDFRNQFEHYKVTANKYQLWAEVTKFLDIIEKFLQEELGIELEKFSKESKRLHNKAKVLRDTVVKFDSVLEKTTFETLQAVAGKEVPGRLLNTDGSITLPVVTPIKRPYDLASGRRYILDFEGESDGIEWAIEIKGAYIPMGAIPVLEQLLDIQQSKKLRTWLIVIGEVSNSVKEFAKSNQVYLTDSESWQEIERMKG